jgi:TPR repeat protein
MYFRGEGISRDYRQAADWFQKAAEQNDAMAQGSLGFFTRMVWVFR